MAEEEYDDYEELSTEEKMAIVRYFVKSTPPGHTKTVFEAVKKLNCADILDADTVDSMMHEYNVQNCVTGDGPDGSPERLVVCAETEIDEHNYLHPSTGKVVTFDHTSGKSGASRDATPEECPTAMKSKRVVLQAALTDYVENNYEKSGAGGVVTEADGRLSVNISAQVIKYSAYWSGRWKSEWTIQFDGAKATVEGTICVMAHYYEKGNVQMHNVKDVPSTDIEAPSDEDFAKNFIAYIKGTEDALQDEYQRMYSSMKDTTFKVLRRTLPITGVKFPWHNPNLGSMAAKNAAADRAKA